MLNQSDIEALSTSLSESSFLKGKRSRAWEELSHHADTYLPAHLPLLKGEQALMESFPDLPKGVTLLSFQELGKDPSLLKAVESRLGTLFAWAQDTFILRHFALLTSGFVVNVPADTRVDEPLILPLLKRFSWAGSHLLILVGKGSALRIMEDLRSEENMEQGGWSHAVEVFLEEEATVEIVSLHSASMGERQWVRHSAELASRASMTWHIATLGRAAEIDHALSSTCRGEACHSTINWLLHASFNEQRRLAVINRFLGMHGEGEITVKGIAEGHAQVKCDGRIEIGPQGGGTNTYLTQKILMLDATAHIDAIPALKIETNDVKASHSATVTKVSEEDLFYFASRGIDRETARGMYTRGFLEDLIGQVSSVVAREMMMQAVEEKLTTPGSPA